MTNLDGALCRGLHLAPLFESTHASNHAEAAQICGAGTATECPAFVACGAMARGLEAGPFDHRPVGTWAGVLYPPEARQSNLRTRVNGQLPGARRGAYTGVIHAKIEAAQTGELALTNLGLAPVLSKQNERLTAS